MGQIEVPIAKLATTRSFEEWIDVKPRSSKDKVSGQVLVTVKYFEVDPEAEKRLKESSKCTKRFINATNFKSRCKNSQTWKRNGKRLENRFNRKKN